MAITLLLSLVWPPGWEEEEEGPGQFLSLAAGAGAKQRAAAEALGRSVEVSSWQKWKEAVTLLWSTCKQWVVSLKAATKKCI